MHIDAHRPDFVDARYAEKHHHTFGACKKRLQIFDRNGSSFLGSNEVRLDMPYVPCPEKREYDARLSTLVVLLKSVCGSSDQVHIFTVMDRPYNELIFLKNLSRSVCDCEFERQMRTSCRPAFVGCFDVQMLAAPLSDSGLFLRCFCSGGPAMSSVES